MEEFYFVEEHPSCRSWASKIPAAIMIMLVVMLISIYHQYPDDCHLRDDQTVLNTRNKLLTFPAGLPHHQPEHHQHCHDAHIEDVGCSDDNDGNGGCCDECEDYFNYKNDNLSVST